MEPVVTEAGSQDLSVGKKQRRGSVFLLSYKNTNLSVCATGIDGPGQILPEMATVRGRGGKS